ncbi:MAG: valine--tRNA ligase, partial [Chitinophagaceae bacterium]
KNLYRHWMENIKDWCISRQLWWGQQIPAWYAPGGAFAVAATQEKAWEELKIKSPSLKLDEVKQDEDCLDTWFSSWLWPFEVFKGYSHPDNEDVKYYYPTNTLVTAPEIIFFWVARMIMAGFEYKQEKPFQQVYFTGIVRDKQGRKMSKSLGNSPDLLALIDQYGADATRFGIMISSPAGNDLLWDESSNEQGSFFINKIWNALKLVKMWEGRQATNADKNATTGFAVRWMEHRLNEARLQLDEQFKDFRLSESLKTIYSLIWDDFCSWYLEWVKPGFEQPIDAEVYQKTVGFFEELMQLLHPFMPFITEEIYHLLKEQKTDLTIKIFPAATTPDATTLQTAILLKEVITGIRDARNKAQLKPKETIRLHILTTEPALYASIESILAKQVNAEAITYATAPVSNTITVVVQKDKFFIETTTELDTEAQKAQLQKDLDYLKGFLLSVEKKLSNEKFVANAKPEVVDVERKKKADAEDKIKVIEESLAAL